MQRHVRFGSRDGQSGLAAELEDDLLDGGGLGEVEDDVPAEEGGVYVDAGALETEDVGGDEDVEGGGELVLFSVHVWVVRRGMGGGVVGGRRGEGEGGMEGS